MKKTIFFTVLITVCISSNAASDSIFVYEKSDVIFKENIENIDVVSFSDNNSLLDIYNHSEVHLFSHSVSDIDSITASAPSAVGINTHTAITMGSGVSNINFGTYYSVLTNQVIPSTGSGTQCATIDLASGYSSNPAGFFFMAPSNTASNALYSDPAAIASDDKIINWAVRNSTELKALNVFSDEEFEALTTGAQIRTLYESISGTTDKVTSRGVGKCVLFRTSNAHYGILKVTGVTGSPAADRKVVFNLKVTDRAFPETELFTLLNSTTWGAQTIVKGVTYKQKDFSSGEILGRDMKFRILEVDPTANVEFDIHSPKTETGTTVKPSEYLNSMSNAIAIVNGSFFDANGEAQTYLRINGTKVNVDNLSGGDADNRNRSGGAIINTGGRPSIANKPSPWVLNWQDNHAGDDLLASGPVLLTHRNKTLFSPSSYNTESSSRRTAFAIKTNGTYAFITIEGSSNPLEIQQIIYALGYSDAINLDGGGSTMLAIKGMGQANTPSQSEERPVSNLLIIKSK